MAVGAISFLVPTYASLHFPPSPPVPHFFPFPPFLPFMLIELRRLWIDVSFPSPVKYKRIVVQVTKVHDFRLKCTKIVWRPLIIIIIIIIITITVSRQLRFVASCDDPELPQSAALKFFGFNFQRVLAASSSCIMSGSSFH